MKPEYEKNETSYQDDAWFEKERRNILVKKSMMQRNVVPVVVRVADLEFLKTQRKDYCG